MSDFQKLIKLTKRYNEENNLKKDRFEAWNNEGIADLVKTTLDEIANEIENSSAFFKKNIQTGITFPSIEDGDEKMIFKARKDIFIKSGKTQVATYSPVLGNSFRSSFESGFEIHFIPTLNGKIHVYAIDHAIDNWKENYHTIEMINNPESITREKIIDLVTIGIGKVMSSSFLFSNED